MRWPRGSTRIAKRLQYRESARTHAAGICTGETYKDRVKITFAQGAALDDPHEVFNASLGGNTRRAIDLREGDELDDGAFKGLVAAAVTHNADHA